MVKKFANNIAIIVGPLYLFVVGILARYLAGFVPNISYLILAIVLGIISANLLVLPRIISEGILNTHKLLLKTGIVVLGARVLLEDIINLGPTLLIMIIGFIIFSLLCVEYLASRFNLDAKFGSCLAAGASVCGVSAVVATGGAIEARESHIAYAIATVLLFDVITVFSYPLLAQLMSLPAEVYGAWAGISMFSTGTTVAAGFAHSETAGQLATFAKMGRNVFIGIWALLYSAYYVNKGLSGVIDNRIKYLWYKFPRVIIGFTGMMLVANFGWLNLEQIDTMKNIYNWLFMMAFVGLGYSIDIKRLKETGFKPFLTVLISFFVVSMLSLIVSYLVFK